MKDWQNAVTNELDVLIGKSRLGLITDVDGTISPIVDTPEEAQVTPRNRELLAALAGSLQLVAVVSGRAAADVQSRVDVPNVVYVGNHGLERWQDGKIIVPAGVSQYRPAVKEALAEIQAEIVPGMMVEDKDATLSIHYRNTPDPDAAATTFRPLINTIGAKHGLRIFEGRMIFEVRPPIEINKGTAVRDLINEFALDAAVYLGDDVTDVDAFKVARQLREDGICYALALGVDSEETPGSVRDFADLLASEISGVESFLSWLLKARSASSS
jgi:trehalose 6-phosphate phosphatase